MTSVTDNHKCSQMCIHQGPYHVEKYEKNLKKIENPKTSTEAIVICIQIIN